MAATDGGTQAPWQHARHFTLSVKASVVAASGSITEGLPVELRHGDDVIEKLLTSADLTKVGDIRAALRVPAGCDARGVRELAKEGGKMHACATARGRELATYLGS